MRSTVVTLALLAVAASSSAFAQVDRGLLNLVPAGTKMIAGIQVDQGKISPFGQYLLLHASKDDPGMQKLMDETGFDPRRDLQEVLFASAEPKQAHSTGLVLARGVFDPRRVKSALVAKGGTAETYQGFDILSGKQTDTHGIVFLDRTLAVAGSRTALKTVIANRNAPTTLDPELEKRMNEVNAGNEAWFASIAPGTSFPARAEMNANGHQINGAVLQSVLQSSGAVHFASDQLNIQFDALTRSGKDAQSLSDVIRMLASMAQMQSENQSEAKLLAPSLEAMQLTTAGSATHVSLSIPESTVEQLLAQSHPRHTH